MDVGLSSLFTLITGPGYCILYTFFPALFALIPTILNFRNSYYFEKKSQYYSFGFL